MFVKISYDNITEAFHVTRYLACIDGGAFFPQRVTIESAVKGLG